MRVAGDREIMAYIKHVVIQLNMAGDEIRKFDTVYAAGKHMRPNSPNAASGGISAACFNHSKVYGYFWKTDIGSMAAEINGIIGQ